ncbi:hypothetical protein [Bacillus sp. JCM 19041]
MNSIKETGAVSISVNDSGSIDSRPFGPGTRSNEQLVSNMSLKQLLHL